MKQESKKLPKNKANILKAEFRQIVHSGFDDLDMGRPPPGYTIPSASIDKIGHLWVPDYREAVCFCELETDEKDEHVTPFLGAILFRDSHCASEYLWRKIVIISPDKVLIYRTAAARREKDLVVEVYGAWNKAQKVIYRPIALSFSLKAISTCWNKNTWYQKAISTLVCTIKSAVRFVLAGIIWFHKLRRLWKFSLSMFFGKYVLKERSVGHLWNPTFNVAIETIVKSNKDPKSTRYKSTN